MCWLLQEACLNYGWCSHCNLIWENLFNIFSRNKMEVATLLKVGNGPYSHCPCRDFIWLELIRSCACCHVLCEFMCAPACLVISRICCFIEVVYHLLILQSFCSLFPEFWESVIKTNHLRLSTTKSLTLFTLSVCESLC